MGGWGRGCGHKHTNMHTGAHTNIYTQIHVHKHMRAEEGQQLDAAEFVVDVALEQELRQKADADIVAAQAKATLDLMTPQVGSPWH